MPSVLQEWVHDLPYMQQSVLCSALRNEDGVEKGHPAKDLIRWYRRCVVVSAFDGRTLTIPNEAGGGNYTGPVDDIIQASDNFLRARDGMSLHYFGHAMHAFQILGYHHPVTWIRDYWYEIYERMAYALHLRPESREEMNMRLGDNPETWRAMEDRAGGCTS